MATQLTDSTMQTIRVPVWKGYEALIDSMDAELTTAHAYDAAACQYHGEFAWLNFPDEAAS